MASGGALEETGVSEKARGVKRGHHRGLLEGKNSQQEGGGPNVHQHRTQRCQSA